MLHSTSLLDQRDHAEPQGPLAGPGPNSHRWWVLVPRLPKLRGSLRQLHSKALPSRFSHCLFFFFDLFLFIYQKYLFMSGEVVKASR